MATKEENKKIDRILYYALKIKKETQSHIEAVKEVSEAIKKIPQEFDVNRALHYALEVAPDQDFNTRITIAMAMMSEASK